MEILFVCLGNICRSPMAEFLMRDLLEKNGVRGVRTASAATSYEEQGNPVHPGTRRILSELGISCSGKTARRLEREDYKKYDLLLGMDENNISSMLRICGGDPRNKIKKLSDFSDKTRGRDISDPWYTHNFDKTYEDISACCGGLLEYILKERENL